MHVRQALYNLLAWLLQCKSFLLLVRRVQPRTLAEPTHSLQAMEQAPRPTAISIWQPEKREGALVFKRKDPGIYGDHYAAQREFKGKKAPGTRRICYFGESAALGYLYAPHFQPARYLERVLNVAAEAGNFEVIDLSMTNERLGTMLEKIEAAAQLDPDVLVLFAGNNWSLLEAAELSPYTPDVDRRHEIARRFNAGGFNALADHIVKRRMALIGDTLARVDTVARENQARVVLVVPEVNLADWESRQPVPFLSGGRVNLWYQLYENAQRQIREQEWSVLRETAFQMWDLDQGTCSTTYRLLTRAFRELGEQEKARAAAQAEIDSVMVSHMVFLNAPQVTSYDQAVMRAAADVHGFGVVDLPQKIRQHSGRALPGREFFLDYCHLTLEGIRIAIDAIARVVLESLGETLPTSDPWLPVPEIAEEHQALAEFGAAIHNAHRLVAVTDRNEILAHWCRKAYSRSPGIANVMVDFIEARAQRLPAVLSSAQQRILNTPYRLLHSHGWKYEGLDIEMILAIQETLNEDMPGIEEHVRTLFLQYHAVERWDTDLGASPAYLWNPLEQSYADLLPLAHCASRTYLRAFWPSLDFVLISEASCDLRLSLAARLVSPARTARARLMVNGSDIGEVQLTNTFRRRKLTIPKSKLQPGINRLSIHWPTLGAVDACRRDAIRRLSLGEEADLAPVFGEVYSLVVRPT